MKYSAFPSLDAVTLDEERVRRGKVLKTIVQLIFVLATAQLLTSVLAGGNIVTILTYQLITTALSAGIIMMIHKGWVQLAGWVYMAAFWLLVAVTTYYYGGTQNDGFMIFIVVAVMSGLVLGRRGGVFFVVLSIAASWTFYYLEAKSILPEPFVVSTPFNHAVIMSGSLLFVILPMIITMNSISNAIQRLREENQHRKAVQEQLANSYEMTLEGWALALELRDKETVGHSRTVTEVTAILAEALGVEDEELINIRRGALLHDIGKMAIPDSILFKPDKLDEDEWEIMKTHPLLAKSMLGNIDFLADSMHIPLYHHENWDGSGYPYGLSGEDIPRAARLFSIVDAWDALLSDRPYRKAWTKEQTLLYLKEKSGTEFDPEYVDLFLNVISGYKR